MNAAFENFAARNNCERETQEEGSTASYKLMIKKKNKIASDITWHPKSREMVQKKQFRWPWLY